MATTTIELRIGTNKQHIRGLLIDNKTINKTALVTTAAMNNYLKQYKARIFRLQTILQNKLNEVERMKANSVEEKAQIEELYNSLKKSDEKLKTVVEEKNRLNKIHTNSILDELKLRKQYYEVEMRYDEKNNLLKNERKKLLQDFEQQKIEQSAQINELTEREENLQRQYDGKVQDNKNLTKPYHEAMLNLSNLQLQLAIHKKECEDLKTGINLELEARNTNFENDLKKLKEELQNKEKSLDECIKSEEESEKEKNRIITELSTEIETLLKQFRSVNSMCSNENSNEITEGNVNGRCPSPSKNIINNEISTQELNRNSTQTSCKQSKPETYKRSGKLIYISDSSDEVSDFNGREWSKRFKNCSDSINDYSSSMNITKTFVFEAKDFKQLINWNISGKWTRSLPTSSRKRGRQLGRQKADVLCGIVSMIIDK
uniref:Uncharacterized protein n=1 Tax=Glossina palpalis gambiensis TaxID=67801 RepID=A0A1B0AT31_9MUSC